MERARIYRLKKMQGKDNPKKETVTTVIDELNERKKRVKNVLIFGLK
jgi:hypothetical protein